MKSAIPCYYHLDVEVGPERIEQVRRILVAHLKHWGLAAHVEPVGYCTGVLLRAIEEHGADKKAVVEMWWNGQHLITAVWDSNPELPQRHYGPQGCLTQIAALSDGWGSCPATDGKIIWFSRRVRAVEHARLSPAMPGPTLLEALEVPREVPVAALAGPPEAEPLAAAAAAASATAPGDGAAGAHALRPDGARVMMREPVTAASSPPV
ncbi:pep a2 [Streptomyces longisporoflavus]|uniref:Pep a2 n=1 Tax=Streptomyces longisporoflavus TaxID=28044 RepID=A0ABW7QHK0_9ACTN